MKMKRKIVLVTLIIFLVIMVSCLYEYTSKSYDLSEDYSSVEIDGHLYYFTDTDWKYNEIDKRIGYLEGDNSLPKIMYLPLTHGIYSLKDDPEKKFYQIKKFFGSKDYMLLVKDDVKLLPPVVSEIEYIKNDFGIKIEDKSIIEELMYYVYSEPNKGIGSSYASHYIKIYSSKYKSIYYKIELFESGRHEWFVRNPHYDDLIYCQIPNELAEKIVHENP